MYFFDLPFSYQHKPKYFGSVAHQILDRLSLATWESILASPPQSVQVAAWGLSVLCRPSPVLTLFNPYMKCVPEHWKINVIETPLPSMSHREPAFRSLLLHVNSQPSTPSIRVIQGPPTLYSFGMLANNANSWAPPQTHKQNLSGLNPGLRVF